MIHENFKVLLEKPVDKKGANTILIHNHKPISCEFSAKATDGVPIELHEQLNISTEPIIYHGSEEKLEAGKNIVQTIVDMSKRIEELLKTNIPIIITEEEQHKHNICTECNLCKTRFSTKYQKAKKLDILFTTHAI